MSDIQKRGPGRPKGTKNKPGAKAGRPRKDAMKTMGSKSHTISAQDAGMHHILEVEILFFTDLATSSVHADVNSNLKLTSHGQLASSGEHVSICVFLAFFLMLLNFRCQ
jgi:hypothetical protein